MTELWHLNFKLSASPSKIYILQLIRDLHYTDASVSDGLDVLTLSPCLSLHLEYSHKEFQHLQQITVRTIQHS